MHCLAHVTGSVIKELIKSADKRLTYIAPGISNGITEEFIKKWIALQRETVQIILDIDEELFRIGCG